MNLIIGSLQHYNNCLHSGTTVDGIDYDTAKYLNGLLCLKHITISTYEERFFHGKYYCLRGNKYSAIVIGSSNVSSSGLNRESRAKVLDVVNQILNSLPDDRKGDIIDIEPNKKEDR